MTNSAQYTGIRIYHRSWGGSIDIEEEVWSTHYPGAWTTPAEIPDDHYIIGFRCHTLNPYYIRQLQFVLGKEGSSEIAGTIRFPTLVSYPSFDQFVDLYQTGDFRLTRINYKHFQNKRDLTAIQLEFSNGQSTPMYETDYSE